MAAAVLKFEVMCSICRDIYRNPVTLTCGHSFCQVCITKTFDNQPDREYFCPECMKEFRRRPELKKNSRLCNIANHFLSMEPNGKKPINVCSYCVNVHVPAVTLCVHCEAFLCDLHQQAHIKSPEHVLVDPTTSLEDRKCPVHKKLLEYFCTVDGTCICAHCLTAGHNGHSVSTISEVWQQKTKKLKPILEKLSSKREETQAKLQSLQDKKKRIDQRADGVAERVTASMRGIRRQQEDVEKTVLAEVSKQKEQIKLSVSNSIQQLEQKNSELHKKIAQLEILGTHTDPLSALQSPEIIFSVLEDDFILDKDTDSITIDDAGDLEETVILQTLHSQLSKIVVVAEKDVNVRDIENVSPSQTKAKKEKTLQANPEDFPHTPEKTPLISSNKNTEMLLDVDTASNHLLISDDLKTVSRSDVDQGRPETLERFQSPNVLSTKGISSGKHIIELEVSKTDGRNSDSLYLGMCYPAIDRRGSQSLNEDSNTVWGLWLHDMVFSVIQKNEVKYLGKFSSGRIKLELDYKGGWLCFHELGNPIKHLHTFTATFTQPLHFIVSLEGRYRVKIVKHCFK